MNIYDDDDDDDDDDDNNNNRIYCRSLQQISSLSATRLTKINMTHIITCFYAVTLALTHINWGLFFCFVAIKPFSPNILLIRYLTLKM